tara:strand:+ start:152 stop:574 length:423 start_codon:yes stop_codon:yes gene_type:complete
MYCYVKKTKKDAIIPSKAHPSDTGYDLTVVDVVKTVGNVTLYGTGIQLCPPEGYYFELVPRSSVIKTGYIQANSIGIIDYSYRGEVMVPLLKIDPSAEDLRLPYRIGQLVLRQLIPCTMKEVDSLDDTERGSGGFGSTGN